MPPACRLTIAVLALAALVPVSTARAQSCDSPTPSYFHPGWAVDPPPAPGRRIFADQPPRRAVGRLCAIVFDTPAPGGPDANHRIEPAAISLTAGGKPVAFTASAPRDIQLKRLEGCEQESLRSERNVAYHRFRLTPSEPLPAGQEIAIGIAGVAAWVTFQTGTALEMAGCQLDPPARHIGPCNAESPRCPREDGGASMPPVMPVPDAGADAAAGTDGASPVATDGAAGTGDAAADGGAGADSAAGLPADAATAARAASGSGCAFGRPHAAGITAGVPLALAGFGVWIARRRRR